MEYQRDENRVHLIVYHLAWCPKRAKPVLIGKIASDCAEIIRDRCAVRNWQLLKLTIAPDRIIIQIRVFPTDSAADVIKELKNSTANYLRKVHPELLKLPSMWNKSYFVSTEKNILPEAISQYVRSQKGL